MFKCCLTRLTCVSPQVRSELQSCVSRQQEALRCREVWLLGQIELLEQVKTETLQQQLHQLHRVTGGQGLFTCAGCLFTCLLTCAVSVLQLRGQFDVIAHQLQNSSSNDLNNQLTSCMEKYVHTQPVGALTPERSVLLAGALTCWRSCPSLQTLSLDMQSGFHCVM